MRIGLAGYMGAGKSTVARALMQRSFRLIDADHEAKCLMAGSSEIRERLVREFGDRVVGGGKVAFRALGEIVFSSPHALARLNAIVHPQLLGRLRGMLFCPAAPDTVLDAALIPLWHIEAWFDLLVWVRAPFAVRRDRILAATGLGRETVEKRMRIQELFVVEPSDSRWCILDNAGTIEQVQAAVTSLPLAIRSGDAQ